MSVLDVDLDVPQYRPRTKETSEAYAALLSELVRYLDGDQPHEVITATAEEVLAVLKNEELKVGKEGGGEKKGKLVAGVSGLLRFTPVLRWLL